MLQVRAESVMWATKQDDRGSSVAEWSSACGLSTSQFGMLGSTARRASSTLSAINSKTGNIYKDASLDLLPGGVPNTPVRRLSEEIRQATSLRALASIYERNYYKTQIWKPKHAAAILMHIPSLIYYQLTAGAGAGGSTNPPSRSSTSAQLRMQLDLTLLLTMMQQELLQPEVTKLLDGDKTVQVLVCLSRLHPTPQHRLNPAELQARSKSSTSVLRAQSWLQGFDTVRLRTGAAAIQPGTLSHDSTTSRQGTSPFQAHHHTGATSLSRAELQRRTEADIALSKAAGASASLASLAGTQHSGNAQRSRSVIAPGGTHLGYGVGLDTRAVAGLGSVYDVVANSLFSELQRQGGLKLPQTNAELLSHLVQAAAVLQPSSQPLWTALKTAISGRLLPGKAQQPATPASHTGRQAGDPDPTLVSNIGRQKALANVRVADVARLAFGLSAARQHTPKLLSAICTTALALGPLPNDPPVLTNLLWACARAKHHDPELCQAASSAFLQCMQLDAVESRYIARFMWACAVLGHLDTDLTARVAHDVVRPVTRYGSRMPSLQFRDGPAELLNVLWAFSALGLHCTAPTPASSLRIGDFRGQQRTHQPPPRAQQQHPKSSTDDLHASKDSISSSVSHSSGSSSDQAHSSSSSSSSSSYFQSETHQVNTPPATATVEPVSQHRSDSAPPPLSLPGVDPHAVYDQLCSQFLSAKMWSISNSQLALLAQSLANAGYHSNSVWLSIGALAIMRVPDMSGGELSTLIAAFSMANVKHAALHESAAQEMSLRGKEAFSGPELVTLLWALRSSPKLPRLKWEESYSLSHVNHAGLIPTPEYAPRNVLQYRPRSREQSGSSSGEETDEEESALDESGWDVLGGRPMSQTNSDAKRRSHPFDSQVDHSRRQHRRDSRSDKHVFERAVSDQRTSRGAWGRGSENAGAGDSSWVVRQDGDSGGEGQTELQTGEVWR